MLHVNQIPILATVSRGVHYGTVAPLPNMKAKTMESAILAVVQSYALRGFVVHVRELPRNPLRAKSLPIFTR